jgi:hypothetical protein
MPIPYLSDAAYAVETLDKCIQTFEKYAKRLKADPDKAANDLAEALEEVEKSCKALDDGIKKYLALGLKDNGLDDGSDVLLDVTGGALEKGVQDGLGSCHKMSNIYHNSVNRWFERVFRSDTDSYRELAGIFSVLGAADGNLFDLMMNTARQLQMHANETLKFVTDGKKQEARAHVLASLQELNGLRAQINRLLASLYGVRAQFIAAARV